jgi:hypothetical protein
MRPTGSNMVNRVSPNGGATIPSPWLRAAGAGGSALTRRMAQRAKKGPAIAAVGIPMTNPQTSTRPVLAFNASIAITGPGCGGIKPCITERNESRGMARSRNGRFVSRVSVRRIGRSSSKPTANQVVRPTAIARAMMHRPTRFGPKNWLNRLARTSAPPDSASNLPSITPRPMTPAVLASVAPRPS